MIKRLYLVNGKLIQPLDSKDEDIAVDAATAAQLNTLNVDDWCYLTILEEDKLEVIKITRMPFWFWVDRAQDNTISYSFSSNAKIVYRLTTQEIRDAVNIAPLNVYPDGYGALLVSTDSNSWTIKYTDLNIQALGGISWMNPDGYEIIITDNSGMFGCCDGSLTGAPYAGGVPFYLTSELYSVQFLMESISNNPKRLYSNQPNNPIVGMNIYEIPGDKMYNSISMGAVNVFGQSIPYSYMDIGFISAAELQDINSFGGIKYLNTLDQYLKLDNYPLEVLLLGNSVDYIDKYKDSYLITQGGINSISVQ